MELQKYSQQNVVADHACTTFSIVLVLFVFLVLYHGRQVEIDSSLDFLWKQQARKELEEMTEMRRHTNQLLHNILPAHVAKYFLEGVPRQSEVSKYAYGLFSAARREKKQQSD